jgi:hypothetical protein
MTNEELREGLKVASVKELKNIREECQNELKQLRDMLLSMRVFHLFRGRRKLVHQ